MDNQVSDRRQSGQDKTDHKTVHGIREKSRPMIASRGESIDEVELSSDELESSYFSGSEPLLELTRTMHIKRKSAAIDRNDTDITI